MLDLIDQRCRRLAISVPGLAAIDSAGVCMPMGCSGQMEQMHGKLRSAGAQGTVARTFEVVPADLRGGAGCRSRQ